MKQYWFVSYVSAGNFFSGDHYHFTVVEEHPLLWIVRHLHRSYKLIWYEQIVELPESEIIKIMNIINNSEHGGDDFNPPS